MQCSRQQTKYPAWWGRPRQRQVMWIRHHLDAVQDLAIVLLKGRVSAIQTVQPAIISSVRTKAATMSHHCMCHSRSTRGAACLSSKCLMSSRTGCMCALQADEDRHQLGPYMVWPLLKPK